MRKRYRGNTTIVEKRTTIVRFFFACIAVLLVLRLADLQIIRHQAYEALASDQHELYQKIFPQRGEIFFQDAGGSKTFPVAMHKRVYQAYTDPRKVDDPEKAAELLAPIIDRTVEDLTALLGKRNDPYEPLKRGLEEFQAEVIRDMDIAGVYLAPETVRHYPMGSVGAHVIGFVGHGDDGMRGQYGIEGHFEQLLAGEQGVMAAERDARGRLIPLSGTGVMTGVDGADIVLTIDASLQFFVCQALEKAVERYGATGGSVLIMHPQDGRIVAMCSDPSFDPNTYGAVENIQYFNNPAIFTAYEPGSVFKPITMAAGLDLQAVTPETTYEDEGSVKIGIHTIYNVDREKNGIQTMVEVLDKSLNTGAVFVAEQVGKKPFAKYVSDFGFGERTDISLDMEVAGTVEALQKRGDIYMATASFGQGITVTPLQLVRAYAAFANGGKLLRPRIVDEIRYSDGKVEATEREVMRQVITERTATLLSGMLVSVVAHGHATDAQVHGYYIAGKTGTAQVADVGSGGYGEETIHTFIGFGPVTHPQFVILVKIDRPQGIRFSSQSAAPLFGEIARYVVDYWQIPPDDV